MVVPLESWHVGSLPADIAMAVGVPTAGVMCTLLIVIGDGPLQPVAVTWMLTFPEKPFAHVITPVVALIDPAKALDNDQLYGPVTSVAMVEYVVVVVPFVS